jgi:radical SAM superfamily enzyme YgiQ (UPF0313 family)
MSKTDILLIYPQLGSFDELLRDIPLSLIYAATDSVKQGFDVKILDLRLHRDNWKDEVDQYLKEGCSLVGLSVMTGNPIATSLKISSYIKAHYNTQIVWGGPHPTILPEQTLENKNIDYVIRDWGSKSLCQLIQYIKGDFSDIGSILGLGYKKNDKNFLNIPMCGFEMLDFHDLPYHLVDISGSKYNRLNNGEVIFPIFTAVGCPYKCSFCMSPAVYKKIKGKKWVPYETDFIISHIVYLSEKYDFQRLQIYDDDSFVDLDRMYTLLSEYVRNGFHKKFKLDFRGARINELDRMDDEFLGLMVRANVDLLAIGVESGSDEILKKMNKGITVAQTIRVNQRFAKFPSLRPHYNFFCGIPGETMESLIETKHLILRLLKDNPNCYLGVGADWKPLPGSVMTDRAVDEYNLSLPANLFEWAAIDSFDADKLIHPWYTKEMNNMIKLLQIAGQLLDKKIKEFRKDLGPILGNFIFLLSILYKPILLLRLKYNVNSFMIEYDLRNFFFHRIGRLMSKFKTLSSILKP